MMRRSIFGPRTAVALAALALVLLPDTSDAQFRGGYRGGYRGGIGIGVGRGFGGYSGYGGYRGYSGYGGYGGYGGYRPYLGSGFYGSYYPRSYGGYSTGYYSTPGYSYYSAPSYSYYTPSYSYANTPSISGFGGTPESYQSFYPPESANDNIVHVRVSVPSPDAEVWFEGTPTQQRGVTREFESPELAPGRSYTYHIRARWMDNGQMRDETRALKVQPGQFMTVDFNRPDTTATTNEDLRAQPQPVRPAANPGVPTAPPVPSAGAPTTPPAPSPVVPTTPPASNLPPRQTPAGAVQDNPPPATGGQVGPTGRVVNPAPDAPK